MDGEPPRSWTTLADDLLLAFLSRLDVCDLVAVSAVCRAWRRVAMTNTVWEPHVVQRWPETAGLIGVVSYMRLYGRMAKADRGVALREPAADLQFMVRMEMEEEVVLAHTLKWSEMQDDGTWVCPRLRVPPALLETYARDLPLGNLKTFFDESDAKLTITAFRQRDGRIHRIIPKTSPELPSEFCQASDYANKATFSGYEERIANASIVLGAQFFNPDDVAVADTTTPAAAETRSGGDGRWAPLAGEYCVDELERFYSGLRLRLGYWPATNPWTAPDGWKPSDWQARFEESSDDRIGFATFVHCLLDGAAEYSWLQVS